MQNDYTEKSEFYFSHLRSDILDEMSKKFSDTQFKGMRFLEIGCGGATTGKVIKDKYQLNEYIGIEYVNSAAQEANKNIDYCYSGKAEDILDTQLKGEKFDAVLFMDVLEHLYDPWSIVSQAIDKLNDGGFVIASIPNVAYYEVIYRIIFDKFEYNPNGGIMDSTHIRWFSKHTIKQLFKNINILSITNKHVNFNRKWINFLLKLTSPITKRYFTIQYIVIAQK